MSAKFPAVGVLCLCLCVCLCVWAGIAAAQERTPSTSEINGIEAGKSTVASGGEQAPSKCLRQCEAAETRCSSEVRRARQECSRNAASAGRDPFTGRRDALGGRVGDYSYFCSYFDHAGRDCGSDIHGHSCLLRFAQRYSACLDAMSSNVAAMRYDCYRSERDAQNFCRDELRDCKAACQ